MFVAMMVLHVVPTSMTALLASGGACPKPDIVGGGGCGTVTHGVSTTLTAGSCPHVPKA